MLRLLDSSVLIDYLRGRPAVRRVRALHEAGYIPCTTVINIDEIVWGTHPEEVDTVRQLFAGLDVLPIGEREGWQAGAWRRDFAARGLTLWQAGCLIAVSESGCGSS